MYVDPSGTMPNWVKWLIGGITFVGAVVLTALTGGSFAPVFISMGVSILSGGIIQGTVNALQGENFWQGFVNGSADGAMWGGIFALGGSLIRLSKLFKNGVAIGENMTRVTNFAKSKNLITYKGMPGYKLVRFFGGEKAARTLSMQHNKAFIERMMNWGIKIVDFGIDTTREYRSFYYLMETIVTNGYKFLDLFY